MPTQKPPTKCKEPQNFVAIQKVHLLARKSNLNNKKMPCNLAFVHGYEFLDYFLENQSYKVNYADNGGNSRSLNDFVTEHYKNIEYFVKHCFTNF